MKLSCAIALGLVSWAMTDPLGATPPDGVLADLKHTMHAREALLQDPVLAPLNLGVRVQGRIAVLWGPAPSHALALRAEARLRSMIEWIDVRNELVILPDDPRDGLAPVAPAQPDAPERFPVLPEPPRPFLRQLTPRPLTVAATRAAE